MDRCCRQAPVIFNLTFFFYNYVVYLKRLLQQWLEWGFGLKAKSWIMMKKKIVFVFSYWPNCIINK